MILRLTGSGESKISEPYKKQDILFEMDRDGVENEVINLYPEIRFEQFEGFGGAITDSAAYVYSLMDQKQQELLMQTYFSDEQMNYRIVRIHMDSCDFSTGMYEAMTNADDRSLESFSFARTEKYILPMLEDAQRVAKYPLELMLSPWSPPSFMKTNGDRKYGGSLKSEYAGMWADYICRYIKEFKKCGFLVRRISLQNEPKAVQTWDSCIYTAKQEKNFLEEYMYPALVKHGLKDTEIFIWDHNKERVYERVEEIVCGKAEKMVAGAACHWYSGDHFESLDLVRRRFPGLQLIISESCIEYSKFAAEDTFANAARLSHEIIGDLNHGVTAFYDWNLLLDEDGGPNHAGNYCQAPFLYDRSEKKLVPQKIQQHFYHFAHFIEPGAVRIGFSRYTDQIEMTAYRNPDGKIIFVMLNRGEEKKEINLRLNGNIAKFTLEGKKICTGEII